MNVYERKCACICTDWAQVLHYSDYLLGLWSSDREPDRAFLPYAPLPPTLKHPSQQPKYYQSFPGEQQRGNVIWMRGGNAPQQQLFPNHNNLGKRCGLYFMGGEGARMFIYLSPQSALRCVCVHVRACDRYLSTHFLLLHEYAQGEYSHCRETGLKLQPALCSYDEYVVSNQFYVSKYYNECMEHGKSY